VITVILGIPASGKSRAEKREVARRVQRGEKILWLTPLKQEVYRLRREFIQLYNVDPSKVFVIPSKLEVCPHYFNFDRKYYHALIGVAVCLACRYKACIFRDFIRLAMKSDEGLFIATHRFIWLSLFFKTVVIDEADFLMPSAFEIIPERKASTILQAIEKVFGSRIADNVRKKYLAKIWHDKYLFRSVFPVINFYNHNELKLISATLTDETEAWLLSFDNIVQMEAAYDEGQLQIYHNTMPTPARRDFFHLYKFPLYWNDTSFLRWTHIMLSDRVMKDYKQGHTVTIIARNRKEARILYSLIRKKISKDAVLAEGINWNLNNFDDWKRKPVRILYIRGRFHRALDIESSKTYAFFQHLHASQRNWYYDIYKPVFHEQVDTLIDFDVYRSHVQTVFRSIRSWSSRYDVYLLDLLYDRAFNYFPHIWDYVRTRIEDCTDVTKMLGSDS